jgi:hypothetical protein
VNRTSARARACVGNPGAFSDRVFVRQERRKIGKQTCKLRVGSSTLSKTGGWCSHVGNVCSGSGSMHVPGLLDDFLGKKKHKIVV